MIGYFSVVTTPLTPIITTEHLLVKVANINVYMIDFFIFVEFSVYQEALNWGWKWFEHDFQDIMRSRVGNTM